MQLLRITDDRGIRLEWRAPPARIVSLVPSDTYSLVRLGVRSRIVGRTRYCVEPAGEVESIPIVGGTKDADIDRIVALEPDLVIANQEENTRADIERLGALGLPVFVSFPQRVAAGLAHLARLARALGFGRDDEPARSVVAAAYHAHAAAERAKQGRPLVRAFVPIWMDPLMTANASTFVSDVLALAGAENVFADRERRYPLAADLGMRAPLSAERIGDRDLRYPRVTLDEVVARAPEIVLLPDEPHAFTEADAAVFRALDIPAARRGAIVFCDGKDLMWYGARSLEGIDRLRGLIDASRSGSPQSSPASGNDRGRLPPIPPSSAGSQSSPASGPSVRVARADAPLPRGVALGSSAMTWTRETVRGELLTLLGQHVQAGATIAVTSHLVADLGIDSLGVMEIVAAIEDRFELRIPDEALREVETVADVAAAIETRLAREGRLDG